MSLVVDKALCPRVSWMTFMSIPAASISVAAVCRRSWVRREAQ
jgi:hypothetical protein